jgi:hypothetical protein
MDGRVARERDPEKADWDEDTADLTHNESGFRPDGAMFLELLEREPTQTISRVVEGRLAIFPIPVP